MSFDIQAAEKRVNEIAEELNYEDKNIYGDIRVCANLLQVSPSLLNLALGYVTELRGAEFTGELRTLRLLMEYIRTAEKCAVIHSEDRKIE